MHCIYCLIFFPLFIFIYSLPHPSSRHIGLYAEGFSRGFPGFYNSTSFPTFQRSGNFPLARHALYVRRNREGSTETAVLMISLLKPSGPGAFPFGRDLAAVVSSAIENGSGGSSLVQWSVEGVRLGAIGKRASIILSTLPGNWIPGIGLCLLRRFMTIL